MADTIPTEMIERTFVFACHIDEPTCLAICRTNKLGRRVATPILYDTIGFLDLWDRSLEILRTKRLCLLLRTLLENRKLARHVHTISHYVHPTRPRNELLPSNRNPLDLHAFEHLFTHDLRLCDDVLPAVRHWLWLRQTVLNANVLLPAAQVLALVILACPRIETLKFEGKITGLSRIRGLNSILTRPPYTTQEILESNRNHGYWTVQTMELCSSVYESHSEQTIQDLIYLPGLKCLKVSHLYMDTNYGMPVSASTSSTSTSSTIQHLELLDLGVGDYDLTPLIAHCNMLKTLIMSWGDLHGIWFHKQRIPGHRRFHISWRRFGARTLRWIRQLEELKLDMSHEVGRWYGDDLSEMHEISFSGIGDLKGLKNLRKVSAPTFVLFGYFEDEERRDNWTLDEILPASCQEVEIFCADHEFTQTDRELLSNPGTERLEVVTIFNCTRKKWISKRNGEGMIEGIDTS